MFEREAFIIMLKNPNNHNFHIFIHIINFYFHEFQLTQCAHAFVLFDLLSALTSLAYTTVK